VQQQIHARKRGCDDSSDMPSGIPLQSDIPATDAVLIACQYRRSIPGNAESCAVIGRAPCDVHFAFS